MFSVLCVAEMPKKKFFVHRRCNVSSVQTAVKGGAPFVCVNVTPSPKGIDWIKVAAASGRSGRNLLLPESVTLPVSAQLTRFVPETLPLKIMLNTAVKQLSGKSGALTRRLLIVDDNAVLARHIDAVVPCAAVIRIVTQEPQAYYEASRRVMERFGASLSICPFVKEGEKFDAAVAPTVQPGASLNFAVEQIGRQGAVPEIPNDFLRICPPGTDVFEFVCALYECSGVRAAGEIVVS